MRITVIVGLLLWATAGFAQQLTPLSANAALERAVRDSEMDFPYSEEIAATRTKQDDCDLPLSGALPVLAGDTLRQRIMVDTTDRGPLTFQCANCEEALFGQASVSGDRLIYIPDPGVSAGIDRIGVAFCSVNTGACLDTLYFDLLARRRNRNYFPPQVTLTPGATTTQAVDAGVLPGVFRCNFFDDCPDSYAGRDQLAYFTDYTAPDENFIYRASRFRGVDSLCVTICDDYGICDTYRFAFRINRSSRNLPFMDDFSYEGPFPDEDLWLDREVFVNQELGILPPSVGVATFDGVNHRGRPWGGNPGQADRLTSDYINLQGIQGTPTLTFWMQRGGLGDRPETKDSLLVQFLAPNGAWLTVRRFSGLPGSVPITQVDTFQFVSIPLTSLFYHANFQFRFINLADRQGMRDQWNIDYVRLDAQLTQQNISDVAFTQLPGYVAAPYTSIPWRHFQVNPEALLNDELQVGLFNHAEQTLNASPSSVSLLEQNSNQQVLGPATLFNGQESNIPNGEHISRNYSLINDPTFPSVWPAYLSAMSSNAFDSYDELSFNLRYVFSNTSQVGGPGLESVQRNDIVERTTVFANYFAYDDGTAETALENGPGRQVAQRYQATVADTLRGIQIHFPHTGGDYTQQDMRLRVWVGQLDGTPEYELRITPDYADTFFDTLQGFTTYPLTNAAGELAPLALPEGDFYVGWFQGSNCALGSCIAVGYDRNNPVSSERISVNNGLGWIPISGVLPGALMIRPVVGSETPAATPVAETPAMPAPRLYPNPAADWITVALPEGRVDFQDWSYSLYDATGARLRQGGLSANLSLAGLPNGMYVMQIIDHQHNQTHSQRIIVLASN